MTSVVSAQPKQVSVLGLPVHILANHANWLFERIAQRQATHVVTLNSEMAMLAQKDLDLARIIRKAELVVPDGAGIVLYLKLRRQTIQRCPGIELVEQVLQRLDGNHPVFFFGGAPGVAQTAATHWHQHAPQLAIAGIQHGYLTPEEMPAFEQTLITLQPPLILVGLGVPRQEKWITAHRYLCPDAVWIGVGGSFDIWAGQKTRAPAWMRDRYLEWVYRLYQEPWRWRRMLALPQFAWRALVDRE
jgi:N-acetylglucosaminyldiphosphoundecaprenol N-acetyl-beta-D-mannosaminyltransferase